MPEVSVRGMTERAERRSDWKKNTRKKCPGAYEHNIESNIYQVEMKKKLKMKSKVMNNIDIVIIRSCILTSKMFLFFSLSSDNRKFNVFVLVALLM